MAFVKRGLVFFLLLQGVYSPSSFAVIESTAKKQLISGMVFYEKHYGPPNYGETPEIDRLISVAIIITDHSVGFEKTTLKPQKIQLLFPTKIKEGYHCITGTLAQAHSGHHVLPYVFDVLSIQQCKAKR